MNQLLAIFWNPPAPQVLEQLGSALQGPSMAQAKLPLAKFLGFSPLPPLFVLMLGIILVLNMLTAEVATHFSTGGCMCHQRAVDTSNRRSSTSQSKPPLFVGNSRVP